MPRWAAIDPTDALFLMASRALAVISFSGIPFCFAAMRALEKSFFWEVK